MIEAACELCSTGGGDVLYRDAELRIVAVTGADGESYRGFCRVIWNAHVKEMTDLSPAERSLFMKTIFKLESVLRAQLKPEKMNIASLGNMTPHLHWHVIPRFVGDATFPKPIWATSAATTDDTQAAAQASAHVGTLSTENVNIGWRRAVQMAFDSQN
jgi:diadenosine tetraphosphate (Ap4A) HIT family hydrolase